MDQDAFQRLRQIAYDEAGIALAETKEELVAARVAKRLRALGLADERGYAEYLSSDRTGRELTEFLDAISTNFTSFFREPAHFDEIRAFLRRRLDVGQAKFRFWSAACSSGEEPVSLAITLSEEIGRASVDWRVLATDISTRVLSRAEDATYRYEQVCSIPAPLRSRYFAHRHGVPEETVEYRVQPSLGQRISFRRLNLSTPPFPMKGPLDAVLCRNVMIYFDRRVRQGLVTEIERLLRPGGLLLISHTETLHGVESGLELVRPSVYRRAGGNR